jgi:hypothetical protein
VPPKAQDPVTPPQVDRTTAIRLLTGQLEGGQRLLETGSVSKDHHARWELLTRHQLAKAFGRGSPHILTVVDAGLRSECPVGADKKWWEAYRVERLGIQLTELAGMLRLLGADPKIAIPRSPRSALGPKVPRTPPKPVARKPAIAPVAAPTPPPALPEILEPEPEAASVATALVEPESTTPADVFSKWESDAPPAPASRPASSAPGMDFFTGVACINGHAVTGAAEAYPGRAAPRCKTCGATTLRACRECGVGLRGGPYAMRLDDRAEPPWSVPNYCHSCGGAFPWTGLRCDAIEAMISELHEIEAAERAGLLALVADIVHETPKTAIAVMRWQRALSKLPAPTRSLVSDVLKQAAVALVAQHLGLTS